MQTMQPSDFKHDPTLEASAAGVALTKDTGRDGPEVRPSLQRRECQFLMPGTLLP